MAIPWLAALKVIPWGDVISHAPTVLEKARELIDRKRGGTDAAASSMATPNDPAADVPSLGELKNRLLVAHQQIDQLHTDQAAMAQTLTALAEQNAALVVMVGELRVKQRMLIAVVLLLVILSFSWVAFLGFGGGRAS
jgi:hypothetical protein